MDMTNVKHYYLVSFDCSVWSGVHRSLSEHSHSHVCTKIHCIYSVDAQMMSLTVLELN